MQSLKRFLSPHRETGNLGLGVALGAAAISGVSLVAINQRFGHDMKKLRLELGAETSTSKNLFGIKQLENLMRQRKLGGVGIDQTNMPIFYPSPYLSPGVKIKPTPALGTGPWRYNPTTSHVLIPAHDNYQGFSSLFANAGGTPELSMASGVQIQSIAPLRGENGRIIVAFEVEASSEVPLGRGKTRRMSTKAIVKVPPPPEPSCSLSLDQAQYNPSQPLTGTLTINGLATAYRILQAEVTELDTASFATWVDLPDDKTEVYLPNQVTLANIITPRPLAVLDGREQYTMVVRVGLLKIDGIPAQQTCEASYRMAKPPMCGLAVTEPVLVPGECTGFRFEEIGTAQSRDMYFNGAPYGTGPIGARTFCAPNNAPIGTSYRFEGKVVGGQETGFAEYTCPATVIVTNTLATNNTDNSNGTGNTNGNTPGGGGTPGSNNNGNTNTNTGTPTPPKNLADVCKVLHPDYKNNLSPDSNQGYQGQAVFEPRRWDNQTKFFEVDVIARTPSPEGARRCDKNDRCYARYTMNQQGQVNHRNRFFTVEDINETYCREKLISRIALGCFAADTRIQKADGSLVKASEVTPGMALFNPLTGKSSKVARVSIGPEDLPMIRISTEATSLTVTTEHPVFTKKGIKAAELLEVGEEIKLVSGKWQKILKLESDARELGQFVYNFALESDSESMRDHALAADGMVVGDLFLQEKLEEFYENGGHIQTARRP